MTSYIPWYGKKRERLAHREQKFIAILRTQSDPEKLRKSAEEIRAAQIRVLKSRRAQLPPSEKNLAKVEEIDHQIQKWLAAEVDSIIQDYRSRI